MARPRLTKTVRRGLRAMRALAISELEADDQGAFHPHNGGESTSAADVDQAITWLDALLDARGKDTVSDYDKKSKAKTKQRI